MTHEEPTPPFPDVLLIDAERAHRRDMLLLTAGRRTRRMRRVAPLRLR